MKNLKDLKEEILNNQINNFYVFYGEDFGLRKHYIDYLNKKFNKKLVIMHVSDLSDNMTGRNLFKLKTLYVIPQDLDFLKERKDKVSAFINKIDKDDCIILDYDMDITNSNFFKNFEEYITYFPEVEDNIAYAFKFNWGRIKIIRDFIIPYEADYLLQNAYEVAKLDEMIKTGKLSKDKLFDYFLCIIL